MKPSPQRYDAGKIGLGVALAGWASLVAGLFVFFVLEYLTYQSNEAGVFVSESRAHIMGTTAIGFLVLNPLLCVLGMLLALPFRTTRLGNRAVLVGSANVLFWILVIGAAFLLTPPATLMGR